MSMNKSVNKSVRGFVSRYVSGSVILDLFEGCTKHLISINIAMFGFHNTADQSKQHTACRPFDVLPGKLRPTTKCAVGANNEKGTLFWVGV